MKPKYTPMMMQYLEIKEANPDKIIMFRLGDFYEMFFDDAKMVSQELSLTLTSRDAGVSERVPMCGVPHHAVKAYIEKLINNGHKVAIVEQLEDPAEAQGIVKRGIIQVITPGTFMDEENHQNNFIAALQDYELFYSMAFCDVATGELLVETIDKNPTFLANEILSMGVREIVVQSDMNPLNYEELETLHHIMISKYDNVGDLARHETHFKEIRDFKQLAVGGLLLNYLEETQKRPLEYIQPAKEIVMEKYLRMDLYAKNALELTRTIRSQEKYGSLLWLLDHCKTAMGSRLIKQWIDKPLIEEDLINQRLDTIELLNSCYLERESIKEILKEVYDLERLAAKVAFGNVNARDLVWVMKTLKVVPELRYQLQSMAHPLSDDLATHLIDLSHITDLIEKAFVETPPLSITEGGMFKRGFNEELDSYMDASTNGKQWILEFEAKEKERTGIRNLKVGYNRVFGYYIEVTKSYLNLVTEDMQYTRKQSLANAERFITPELKEVENKIIHAQDHIEKLEHALFLQIRDYIRNDIYQLQDVAKTIATIDAYISLAQISSSNRYVRPIFNHDHVINIENGRHAVIEEVMKKEQYVENNISLNSDQNILLITGPNMGGKSTYMRQVALIAIMAQIGCFVPATYASLPIFDQLFTRIGASDDLISGQSTFMVEMMEARTALSMATEDSLLIFDEIGRGTATFDGMAIAQSIVEYICNKVHCKTLFSTHYHELTYLDEQWPSIKNVHAAVSEKDEHIVFLYKIKEGRSNKSYGVNVARLAHLPEEILTRAQSILIGLENGSAETVKEATKVQNVIEKKSEVEAMLSRMDPLNMSPMEALSALMALKDILKKEVK